MLLIKPKHMLIEVTLIPITIPNAADKAEAHVNRATPKPLKMEVLKFSNLIIL